MKQFSFELTKKIVVTVEANTRDEGSLLVLNGFEDQKEYWRASGVSAKLLNEESLLGTDTFEVSELIRQAYLKGARDDDSVRVFADELMGKCSEMFTVIEDAIAFLNGSAIGGIQESEDSQDDKRGRTYAVLDLDTRMYWLNGAGKRLKFQDEITASAYVDVKKVVSGIDGLNIKVVPVDECEEG